jgi:hypothetical protein
LTGSWSRFSHVISTWWEAITRLFNSKLQDKKVHNLVLEVIWDHAELEEDKPAFYRNLNARVQSSLDKSIPLVKEIRDIEHQIVKTGEEISENIRPILPPIKDGLSPLEVLGKRLATINSEALAIDRKSELKCQFMSAFFFFDVLIF